MTTSRRTFIKTGTVATGVVWSAPVIDTVLAVPAAAASNTILATIKFDFVNGNAAQNITINNTRSDNITTIAFTAAAGDPFKGRNPGGIESILFTSGPTFSASPNPTGNNTATGSTLTYSQSFNNTTADSLSSMNFQTGNLSGHVGMVITITWADARTSTVTVAGASNPTYTATFQ